MFEWWMRNLLTLENILHPKVNFYHILDVFFILFLQRSVSRQVLVANSFVHRPHLKYILFS